MGRKPAYADLYKMWLGHDRDLRKWRNWGDVFWVDATNGSDTDPGNRPGAPFKTLEKALDEVTDNNNDVIWHKGYENLTAGLTIDTEKTSILGWAYMGSNPVYPETGSLDRSTKEDAAVLIIDADFVEIAGLTFNCDWTTGQVESPALRVNEGANKSYIHDCYFPDWARANMRAGIQLEGCHFTVIERCTFQSVYGNIDAGILTTGGSGSNPASTIIKDCKFKGGSAAMTYGINEVDGLWQDFLVENCKFNDVTYMTKFVGDGDRRGQFVDCYGDMLETALFTGGSGADDKQALWTNHSCSALNCWGRDALIADS